MARTHVSPRVLDGEIASELVLALCVLTQARHDLYSRREDVRLEAEQFWEDEGGALSAWAEILGADVGLLQQAMRQQPWREEDAS
jgi:hypothetical protein